MAHLIGAKDRIDRLLVQKYSDVMMNNLNTPTIPEALYWRLTTDIAKYEHAIRQAKVNKK